MVKDKPCPKCGNDSVSPQYHSDCLPHKKYYNLRIRSNTEHLHYICSCGYDFIDKVEDNNSC